FMPLGGRVIEVNDDLETHPELVNEAPYGNGWMIRVELSNPDEIEDLLPAGEYRDMLDRCFAPAAGCRFAPAVFDCRTFDVQPAPQMHERIVILDFGSQYTQLIARRVREVGVYSEIHPCTAPPDEIAALKPRGLILSGGPCSVYDSDAPQLDAAFLRMEREEGDPMPILGICYGLQAMAHLSGGVVERADHREFGRASLIIDESDGLLDGVPDGSTVWMSHGDSLTKLPDGYRVIAHTDNAPVAAVRSETLPHYGVQFHPEVVHTDAGRLVLENFVLDICGCRGDWTPASFIDEKKREIRETVGEDHVILGLSGGVDSSVAAVLLHEAIG